MVKTDVFSGIKKISFAFFLKIMAAALGFSLNVFVARTFGAEVASGYFVCIMILTMAGTLGTAGFTKPLARNTSINRNKMNFILINETYTISVLISAIAAAVISLIVCIFVSDYFVKKAGDPGMSNNIKIISLAIIPYSLSLLHVSVLEGMTKIFYSNIILGLTIPLFTLSISYFVAPQYGIEGVISAYTLATVISLIFGVVFCNLEGVKIVFSKINLRQSELLIGAKSFWWVLVFNQMFAWAGVLFLSLNGATAELSLFQVASRTALLTSMIMLSINSVFSPKIAVAIHSGDKNRSSSIFRDSSLILYSVCIPFLILVIIFSGKIMSMFGSDFAGGSAILRMLSLAQLFNVLTGLSGQVLVMSGNEKRLKYGFLHSTIIAFILSAMLVPLFEGFGAAIAVAVSTLYLNIFVCYWVFKIGDVNIFCIFNRGLLNDG